MHPQSELENYKLQVELLQEKLHRSEDNRRELEGKLEQIMKKRNEHERTLRSRSQRKYQQFLDEQKKRNERNRKLVEMLERIDQEAAALSARSERLKMMKLQYELYFAKLVQSYSMKTIQSIPTIPFLPIQRQPNTYPTIRADNVAPTETYQASFNNNTSQIQAVSLPVVVPISNEQNRFNRSWTFATTPPGVLIALANNSTYPSRDTGDNGNAKNECDFSFDYSQFPIGYLQTPTTTGRMQCNVGQPYSQQPQYQKPSTETHCKPLFVADDEIEPSRPNFEFSNQTPSSFSFADVENNETTSNKKQPESKEENFDLYRGKPKKNDDLNDNEDKEIGHESENFAKFRVPEMSSVPRQSLKVDKLPNINPNNSFQQKTEDGRIVHRGNKPNTTDFRTNDDEYMKYIKEMKETYEKNVPIPINVTPQEHSIDNITTTLQTQKIDETNVRDDEKINDDVEDNEKNTSSAFPPLGGKCSIESIGDEALTKKPLENKTEENISNTAARNTDPNRDTEQITLFNGTKNSKDESTGASNRTTAIIDGGGENTENTRLETSYRPMHFDKKEKMSIENIETAIYGELITKPESLTSAELLDKPGDNEGGEEIEPDSQETQQYGFNNSVEDSYEQEQVPGIRGDQNIESYPMDSEQSGAKNQEVGEGNQESYNYTENDPSTGMQEYDMQNYNYSDPVQEYKETDQEEVPQEEYSFTEGGQQPQAEDYTTDYQNYDASQYEGEYDPNAYRYDYEQQQYDDPNQAQYPPEMYNQEYQQDPYSEEYANYEQNVSNQMDPSNEPYTEQQFTTEAEEAPEELTDKTVPVEQEQVETEAQISKQISSNAEEPNEEATMQKVATPTSILSTEKHADVATKKKKRVNFVDSETDESSTQPKTEAVSSESDFDFTTN